MSASISHEKVAMSQRALEVGQSLFSEPLQWINDGCMISVMDNIAYIYALFCSRKAENVMLGAGRLSALLHFANGEAHMPDYLHQYPSAKGVKTSLYMAATLELILKDFEKVVPPGLASRLKEHITQFCSAAQANRDLMNPFARALFTYLAKEPISEDLTVVPTNEDQWLYFMLLAHLTGEYEALYQSLEENYLPQYQKPKSSLYPFFLEGLTPYRDLFHYVVNYDHLADSELTQNPYLILRSALFTPVRMLPYEVTAFHTHVLETDLENYSAKTGHSGWQFSYLDDKAMYSLVMGDGIKPALDEASQTLTWALSEESFEDKERREVLLYFNNLNSPQIHINGELSTLFRLGDTVSITTNSKVLELRFTLEEGRGDFVGQISFGCRGAQKKEFEVGQLPTDQIISLRTLRREGPVKLSMHYTLRDKA